LEQSGIKHQGERLATLEASYENIVNRLNHLDKCVDEVKKESAKESALQNKRWYIVFGLLFGISVGTGLNVKTLLTLAAKIQP
jgi:tetrahydromethanopterin S-methyltransferase subunit G